MARVVRAITQVNTQFDVFPPGFEVCNIDMENRLLPSPASRHVVLYLNSDKTKECLEVS